MVFSPQSENKGSIFQLSYKIRWKKSYCTVAVNNEGTLTLLNQLPELSYKGQRVTRLLKMCGEKRDYCIETFWQQVVDAFQQRNRPFKSFSIQNVLSWPFYMKDIKLANYISTHQLYEIVKAQKLFQCDLRRERNGSHPTVPVHQEWNRNMKKRSLKCIHLILFSFNKLLWQVIKRYESHIVLK